MKGQNCKKCSRPQLDPKIIKKILFYYFLFNDKQFKNVLFCPFDFHETLELHPSKNTVARMKEIQIHNIVKSKYFSFHSKSVISINVFIFGILYLNFYYCKRV